MVPAALAPGLAATRADAAPRAHEARHVLASLFGGADAIGEQPRAFDRGAWAILGELGWLGAAIPAGLGGSGDGHGALCALAEEAGRVHAPLPLSSSIALASELLQLAGSPAQQAHWLPRLARGASIACVAVAESAGRWDPARLQTRCTQGRLSGSKQPVLDGMAADLAIVAARDDEPGEPDEGMSLYLVELDQPGVRRTPVPSVDPTRDQALLRFEGASAHRMAARAWPLVLRALDRAAVIVSFEQLGGAQRCLELARDAARARSDDTARADADRRLRDIEIAVDLARSHCEWAAWSLQQDAPDLSHAAAAARVSAMHAAQMCARECLRPGAGVPADIHHEADLHARRAHLLASTFNGVGYWQSRWIDALRAATTQS